MSQGSDINVCIMSGALDSMPRVNKTKNDNSAVSFSMAVNRQINTADGLTNMTSWYNVGSFNQGVVEMCGKLNKGDRVIVQGALTVRTWMDQASGQKKLRYEISADRVTVVGASDTNLEARNAIESDIPDSIFE